MYYQNFYANLKDEEISRSIIAEGFDPMHYTNGPGDIYPPHKHPETKLLAFLSGSMDVVVGEEKFHCVRGDKLVIAGNVTHSARVGNDGCTFFWSEKLM
ncbi:AraC family ligand binding domain-containing protein [Candidatus Gottesmanbacteria bacterium]|nr:AraC family ligand binding domain-containing protein [Candidatus Gottesmanbacteria bacterium]